MRINGSKVKVHEMLVAADTNHDGTIDEEEFMKLMKQLQRSYSSNPRKVEDHTHDINKTKYVKIDVQIKK